jgi:hypothetical protein
MNPEVFLARLEGRAPAESESPAELLDAIAALIHRFVVISQAQADVIALWVLHTWTIAAADVTLFLAITSAEMRSGKTRLLEVLELLVRRPWRAISPSEAVLFRKVSAQEPTLLLDETDAIFSPKAKENEGLRALLNAGNRRGATVDRCVPGGKGEIRLETFSVFCPRALAGIGKLPATVADRSLPIRLKRRVRSRREEQVERFRFRDVEKEAETLRRQIEAWAVQSVEALRRAERPGVPDALDDRQADGAEPLLAIADSAGEEWPKRAREALVELCSGEGTSDDSLSVRLLRDVLTIFDAGGVDRLHSADLCDALAEMEEAPWGDYKGKPIKPRALAWLLELFEVRSSQVKIDGRNRHGYTRDAFSDAWSRYVSAPTPSASSSETLPTLPPAPALDLVAISETLPLPTGSVLENGEPSIPTGTVAEVADKTATGDPCDYFCGPRGNPCARCRRPFAWHLNYLGVKPQPKEGNE